MLLLLLHHPDLVETLTKFFTPAAAPELFTSLYQAVVTRVKLQAGQTHLVAILRCFDVAVWLTDSTPLLSER